MSGISCIDLDPNCFNIFGFDFSLFWIQGHVQLKLKRREKEKKNIYIYISNMEKTIIN